MRNRKSGSKLWLYFAGIIFATIFVVFLAITLFWILLYRAELISMDPGIRRMPLFLLSLESILLGTVLAFFVGKLVIRPIQNISDAFSELSKGNFSVQIATDEKVKEIRELARHFNAMTHDLSNMETLRSDFVANVSHEFKTPIAAMEGYATLLQNPNLTREKHDRYVEIILENSRRLSDLVSSILALSKLENQEMIIDNCWFRLDEQIRRSILLLEGKWSQKNLEFDLDLPKQMYYGSETLLAQVWSNILDNAIKYSPEGGEISVNLCVSETCLTISICDHGDGMDEEVQKHIFEKFYQGDSSRKEVGCGLGLALVQRIVQLCDGRILTESTPGVGTTFFVELPLVQAPY